MSKHYTRLEAATAAFDEMIKRFGVVTVMDVRVYETEKVLEALGIESGNFDGSKSACDIRDVLGEKDDESASVVKPVCILDTLKTSNITLEGPTKTVTGGQNASPLLKYGKTARLEMQDALGNSEALEALGGMTVEYEDSTLEQGTGRFAVHATDTFGGPKTILGKTFFINQKNGAQVPVEILIYQFVPDSLFNLTQDAEGDATVFDLNGDLIATKVRLGDIEGNALVKNTFYSILKEGLTVSGSEAEHVAGDGPTPEEGTAGK